MATEADTCRKFVLPKLYEAGWNDDLIVEQRSFTDGRIVPAGNSAKRRAPKRADYLLRYTRDFILAVVEAKAEYKKPGDGLQQAKLYAQMLGLRFAYSTNGHGIVEFDFITGVERELTAFPSPAELWARLRSAEKLDDADSAKLLTPANLTTGKEPRYYQRIAIDRTVQAILQGRKRSLLTMATGTGKTVVAFQICWKLWWSKWNASGKPNTKPRILYLADRNFLVDDPKDKIFAPFGDARHKIEGGVAVFSRQMYFATYQAIAKDERRPGLFKEFPPDFFDLIIVDECHRGSAKEESNWREILEYFQSAYQLGMTATPLREENRDTYLYFGNPLYTYSLKQGIDDGFLAPYRVHRVITQWDAAGWRKRKAEFKRLTAKGKRKPEFERRISAFRFQPLAFPRDIGRGHMQRFQDVETTTPAILTTSQLLTTGLDAPTCKNVVLVRVVNSMVEFKQIIGRGTRVRDDYGKLWFNILDYTGAATRNFADPDFDGEPALVTEQELEDRKPMAVREKPDEKDESKNETGGVIEETVKPRRKFYFDGGRVEIDTHFVYELDADGRQLRVVKFTDYTAEKVRTSDAETVSFLSIMSNRRLSCTCLSRRIGPNPTLRKHYCHSTD